MSSDFDRPVLPVHRVLFRMTRGQFRPTRDTDDRATLMTDVDALGRPVRAVYRGNVFTGRSGVAGWQLGDGSSLMCAPAEVVAFLESESKRRRQPK